MRWVSCNFILVLSMALQPTAAAIGADSKDMLDMVRVASGAFIMGSKNGLQDARPDELMATHRGRQVSRNPRGGHHNISFRCAG